MFKRSRTEYYNLTNLNYPSDLPALPEGALQYIFMLRFDDYSYAITLPEPLIKLYWDGGTDYIGSFDVYPRTVHVIEYEYTNFNWTEVLNYYADYIREGPYPILENLTWTNYNILDGYTGEVLHPSDAAYPHWQTCNPEYYSLNNSNWKDCRAECYDSAWK